MSKINSIAYSIIFFCLLFCLGFYTQAQTDSTNYISCMVDGKEFKAEAKKLRLPFTKFSYLAFAGFKVSPDIQVWIRLYYYDEHLEPGTYQVISESNVGNKTSKEGKMVYALIDYTEEISGMGHGYHDGESMEGVLTITKTEDGLIEGTFEATLNGVYYKKRPMATISGTGIKGNLRDKLITKSGGGMVVNSGPHDHVNTKKEKKTDTIVITDGQFSVAW